MQKTLPEMKHMSMVLLAALLLTGCSSGGRSLLALETEKAEVRSALAQRIGVSGLEVDQALISSPEQERKTAHAVVDAIVTRVGTSSDVEMSDYLQAMADHLAQAVNASDRHFQIILLKSRQANAFTPGGGIILVNEGLLQFAENEAEVAAVIAHEMAHVMSKHPQRQKQIRLASKAGGHFLDDYTPTSLADNLGRMLRLGGNVTMNGLIRQQEMMADSIGIDILVKAGYNPRGMATLLHKLNSIAPSRNRATNVVYGNHPLTIDREKAAVTKINRMYRTVAGKTSSPSFDMLVKPYRLKRMKRLAESN